MANEVKNTFLKLSVNNQILLVQNFKKELQINAKKDDGIIDKQEAKLLRKLERISDKYVSDLNKLV